MQVIPSSMSIAEYCDQMKSSKIIVNHEYQRSPKVWPTAARSYLIDTILTGFPIPKLSLYQVTDLRRKLTIKEIVDGQQRSEAILAFYNDELRMTGRSSRSGKKFSGLTEDEQNTFLNYPLSVDTFVGATKDDIRQVFKRINAYTVPLNPQETRHATYQGAFKWFIQALAEQYASVLGTLGVFSERQMIRMEDAKLLADVVVTLDEGIASASEARLNKYYERNEKQYVAQDDVQATLDRGFAYILEWRDVMVRPLTDSYNFYTLLLAACHCSKPSLALSKDCPLTNPSVLKDEVVRANLGKLAAALEQPQDYQPYPSFVEATSKGTNRITQRRVRFQYFCKAMSGDLD